MTTTEARTRITEIESFSGGTFEALIDIEHDGTLSILTAYRPGYGSAHIGYAHHHFGRPAAKELERRYICSNGAERVLTCWQAA